MDQVWNQWQLGSWINHPVLVTDTVEITVWSVIVLAVLFTGLAIAVLKSGALFKDILKRRTGFSDGVVAILTRIFQLMVFYFGGSIVLDVSDIDVSAGQIFEYTSTLFRMPLIPVGEQPITLWMILFVTVLGFALTYFTGKLQRWMAVKLRNRPSMDYGTAQSVTSIARYLVLAVGFVVILQAAGIDLSTVTVLAGALGLGVGLGLQNIVSNLVSGLVVMFERPVKVGDRIEVGGVLGDVMKLSLRAATIRTNNNIEIIVPNNEFINGNVVNLSHSSRDVRMLIPVGVSYNADPKKVKECLLKAANECEDVLRSPEPDVVFDGFGDSALNFELRVYTSTLASKPKILKSNLNFLIFEKLQDADIEIPFPQRDLHIRSSFTQSLKEETNGRDGISKEMTSPLVNS